MKYSSPLPASTIAMICTAALIAGSMFGCGRRGTLPPPGTMGNTPHLRADDIRVIDNVGWARIARHVRADAYCGTKTDAYVLGQGNAEPCLYGSPRQENGQWWYPLGKASHITIDTGKGRSSIPIHMAPTPGTATESDPEPLPSRYGYFADAISITTSPKAQATIRRTLRVHQGVQVYGPAQAITDASSNH